MTDETPIRTLDDVRRVYPTLRVRNWFWAPAAMATDSTQAPFGPEDAAEWLDYRAPTPKNIPSYTAQINISSGNTYSDMASMDAKQYPEQFAQWLAETGREDALEKWAKALFTSQTVKRITE